jgi:hypothetical protein
MIDVRPVCVAFGALPPAAPGVAACPKLIETSAATAPSIIAKRRIRKIELEYRPISTSLERFSARSRKLQIANRRASAQLSRRPCD